MNTPGADSVAAVNDIPPLAGDDLPALAALLVRDSVSNLEGAAV